MAKNKLDVKLNLPNDRQLSSMFAAVPQLERYKVLDKSVQAAVRPVVKRARELAPRSSKTGTDKKRSKSQREKADWNYPLWKTIAAVVRKYRKRYGFAVIGPRWPKGNKAYFNTSPSGRKQVLWGRRTGVTVPQIRNWIVQAFDETKPEQLAAMKAKLVTLMDQAWRQR